MRGEGISVRLWTAAWLHVARLGVKRSRFDRTGSGAFLL